MATLATMTRVSRYLRLLARLRRLSRQEGVGTEGLVYGHIFWLPGGQWKGPSKNPPQAVAGYTKGVHASRATFKKWTSSS